jgi:cystathionine beta-lyase/cystathionine gamma-synthase
MNDFTHRPAGHRDTIAVHYGENRWLGSITTPIDMASTFVFKNVAEMVAFASGKVEHYEYGRYGNPTRETAELKLAALEGAERCILFDCGMSAVCDAVLRHQCIAAVRNQFDRRSYGRLRSDGEGRHARNGNDHFRIAHKSLSEHRGY